MKIALHICCGVCAAGVVERLTAEGHQVHGFFYNPNIQPAEEYERRRELAEEVRIETDCEERCVGLINDDLTDVGKVHLGVVHIFDVRSTDVRPREEEIVEAGFVPVEELLTDLDSFESWSQICLTALFRSGDR